VITEEIGKVFYH